MRTRNHVVTVCVLAGLVTGSALTAAPAGAGAVGPRAVPAAAAPMATITGQVPQPTGAFAEYLRPLVTLYRLAPSYQAYSPPVTAGRYRLRAPAGVYVAVETTWKTVGQRAVAVRDVSVQIAPAGSTTAMRVAPRAADVPDPAGPLVSVGTVDLMGRGDVRPEVESALVNGFQNAPCSLGVVEDARYGVMGEIMKEVRLRATTELRPEDRRSLQDSLAILTAWRATYRLFGSVSAVEGTHAGTASGTFRLVRLDTGKTAWSSTVTVADGGFEGLRRRVADEVSLFSCGFPERIRVGADVARSEYFGGQVTKEDWRATWDLKFLKATRYADGVSVVTYQAYATTVTFWDFAYEALRVGKATWSGKPTGAPTGLVNLQDRRGVRSYSMYLHWAGPKVPVTLTCPPCASPEPTTVMHDAMGTLTVKTQAYERFPIRGAVDQPAAPSSWTMYDMTKVR